MNQAQREQRVKEALKAYHEEPGEKETAPLPWRGRQKLFPVVALDLDVVLLNTFSHRLQAVLEGERDASAVGQDPWSSESQRLITELLKRRHRNFVKLKDSLRLEGQRDPGIITRKGVLLNANTRAAALRELGDPEKRWIRVAVLPDDAEPSELAQLELALQVQDPLKDKYQLTEELLFIEDMAREYGMSPEQIAIDLRWASDDGRSKRHGADAVKQRRRILALIREMQTLTDPTLPLTVFDDKLEQLKALEQRYNGLLEDDSEAARSYRLNWLAAVLAGASSVHQLRAIDEEFAGEYLAPRLQENELLGEHAADLIAADDSVSDKDVPGVELLGDEEGDQDPHEHEPSVKPLLDLLAGKENTVKLPGAQDQQDRPELMVAVAESMKLAISDRKAAERVEGELDQPVSALRDSVKKLRTAEAAFRAVQDDEQFDQRRRSQFEYQLRQVRKQLKKITELTGEEE